MKAMNTIALSELVTVRVTCKKCNRGVIEVPIDRLDTALANGECRFCTHRYHRQQDPFHDLKIAVEQLNKLSEIEVTFVIPAKPQED